MKIYKMRCFEFLVKPNFCNTEMWWRSSFSELGGEWYHFFMFARHNFGCSHWLSRCVVFWQQVWPIFAVICRLQQRTFSVFLCMSTTTTQVRLCSLPKSLSSEWTVGYSSGLNVLKSFFLLFLFYFFDVVLFAASSAARDVSLPKRLKVRI